MSKIMVDKVGDRLHVKPASYLGPDRFAVYLEMLKRVGGLRFSKKTKTHTAVLDLETCRRLREVFGKSLAVGSELGAWARAEISRETSLASFHTIDLNQPVKLDLVPQLAPKLAAALADRGYQPPAVKFAAQARRCLIADQPGLGKTLEALGALIEAGVSGNVLVIAPKTSLRTVWVPEIKRWLGEIATATAAHVRWWKELWRPAAKRERAEIITQFMREGSTSRARLRFLVVNPEMARARRHTECPAKMCDGMDFECSASRRHRTSWEHDFPELHDFPWDAIIADETHKMLLNSNIRSKRPSQVGTGMKLLQTVEDGIKLALSGTPMKGRPHKLWGTLNWLRPTVYTSEWNWIERYFGYEENGYGRTINSSVKPHMEAALDRELSRIMIRRTKDELRKINPKWMPPPKQYVNIWVDLDPKQLKHYQELEKQAATILASGTLSANGILAELTRLKQFAVSSGDMRGTRFVPELPSVKFDWLVDFLAERGITGTPTNDEGNGKVVVASQFTSVINLFAAELRRKGIEVFVLTGETPDNERERQVSHFQRENSAARVFLLNTNAGGVSVTLDAADDLVMLDETWVPDDQEQVEDRIHRASDVEHSVTIYYVRSRGTVEEQIAATVAAKDEAQKLILDGRRGVEWARKAFAAKEA